MYVCSQYVLTPEGIDYLREYLHLPAEIVPATFKKQVRAQRPGQPQRPEGAYRAPRGGDEGYRRRAEGGKEGAGDDFRPRFAYVSCPCSSPFRCSLWLTNRGCDGQWCRPWRPPH